MPQPAPQHLPCLSRFRPGLLARAEARMGPQLRAHVEPADIVHETLLKAHRARDRFRGHNEHQLAAWLNSILTNSIRDAVRSLRVTAPPGERPTDGAASRRPDKRTCPVWTAILNEELRRLSKALVQLPANQRVVLELKFMQGCSLAEISNRTGRTKASVTGLLYRGTRLLRTLLADSG
jgi:RNA polymerase sigma-70 factor (ECF subfamily)